MNKQSSEPIQVTKQQMIDYIFSQPDDRRVNFRENWANQDCGCVMVHYGKDNGFEFVGCGTMNWENWKGKAEAEIDVPYGFFQPDAWKSGRDEFTYREIKGYLLSQGCKPTEVSQ